MEFRKLTIDDYSEIVELWSRAGLPFRPEGRDSYEAIRVQMRANPDFFIGAFMDSRLVGVAIISSDLRKGWINRLAIDPDHRRLGFAKALICECERTLRKHGLRMFCALIENSNVSSKELFKRCGYVEHDDIIYFSKRENDDV